MAWSGFGTNVGPQKGGTLVGADADNSVSYIKEMMQYGIKKARIHIPDWQSQGAVIQDYGFAANCKIAGMPDYNMGMSSNSFNNIALKISLSTWQQYRNFMLVNDGVNGMGMAEFCKRQGCPRLYIGNEEESHHTFKTSTSHGALSITSSGTLATAVVNATGAKWNYVDGQQVTIAGATQSAYNGTFTIHVVDDKTFTYTMLSAPGTNATGSIMVYDFTDAQLRGMLRQLATDIKTLWGNIPGTNPLICYSTPSDTGGDQGNSAAAWAADGNLGDIDRLGLNVYGNGNFTTFSQMVNDFAAAFGPNGTAAPNRGYVSEWNIHQDWPSTVAQGLTPNDYDFYNAFSDELWRRYQVIRNSGLSPAFYFNYYGISVLTPDYWALKMTGSKYNKMRDSFTPGRFNQAFYRLLELPVAEIAKVSAKKSVRKVVDLAPPIGVDFGKAVLFDQATSKLQFTVPSAWTAAFLQKISMAVWLYPLSIGTSTIRLLDIPSLIAYLYNIGVQGQVQFSGNIGLGVSGPVVPVNRWTHVYISYDPTQANTNYPVIYINTFERQNGATSTPTGTMTGSGGGVGVIGNRATQDRAFNGYMTKLAMWNTADEINMINHFNGKINQKNLIFDLRMDETSGNLTDLVNGVIVTPTDVQLGQSLPSPKPRQLE
jgi:hypothetical protein